MDPNWPYAPAQLYEGSSNTPLPKGKPLGVLPQGKVEESPYGKISQLKVCQLLSARPQVIYPVGLNGNNEPVTTTLPELLHCGASITTNRHPYMRINIPPPPLEEPEHTTLLVDKAHTIPAANSPKTPQKPRVSIAAKVNDLLTWAMADKSTHKSEHSPIGKVATVEAVASPPHKSEASPCHSTLLLKQVWRRQRLLLRVSQPMSPPSPPSAAEEVLVHQWTP